MTLSREEIERLEAIMGRIYRVTCAWRMLQNPKTDDWTRKHLEAEMPSRIADMKEVILPLPGAAS